MRTSPRLLALTAVLCTGMAVPAMAALVSLGSVGLTGLNTATTIDLRGNLPPRVEALSLQAHDSDIMCRDVTARFRNGESMQIFRGFLPRGRDEVINMIPVHRDVDRVDFDCHSTSASGGRIDLAADVPAGRVVIDRYITGNLETTGWIPLASEDFIGPDDHAMTFTGWAGRNVDALALLPTNDDAVCTRIRATFGNGEVRDLSLGSDFLRQDRMMTLGLPGFRRDVTRIDMSCRAEHGNMVTVQVLASK
jgi:hypothetical protein